MNHKKLVGMAAAIAAGAVLAVSGGGAAQAEEPIPHLQPLLQMKVVNGGHFFTANLAEERNAIDRHGFKQTSPGTGLVSPTQYKNLLVPLYRCKATTSEAWLLTLDPKEVGAGTQYEGFFNCDATDESGRSQGYPAIIGWVSPKAEAGLAQLLRMNNGSDSIVVLKGGEGPWIGRGYHVDGSLGYVYSLKGTDPLPALALWKPGNLDAGAQYTLDIHDADNAINAYGLELTALHLGYWRSVKFAEADRELYRYTINGGTSSIISLDRKEVDGNPSFHYDGPVGWVSSRPAPGLTPLLRFHKPGKAVWILALAKDEKAALDLGLEKEGVLGYVWEEFPVQEPAKPASAAAATTRSSKPSPSPKPAVPKKGLLGLLF